MKRALYLFLLFIIGVFLITILTSIDHGVTRFRYCDLYQDTTFKGTIKTVCYFDFYEDLGYLQISVNSEKVVYCISQYAIFENSQRLALKLLKDNNTKSQILLYVFEPPLPPDTVGLSTNKTLDYIELINFNTRNKITFYNE